MRNKIFSLFLATPAILLMLSIQAAYGQDTVENYKAYADHTGTFTLSYPEDLEPQGNQNVLGNFDLTLGNSSYPREFTITITYKDNDTSLVRYTNNLEISPENYLMALEGQVNSTYQKYNSLNDISNSDELNGFPTVSNTVDFTKQNGESGRTMYVLAIINGQGSFLFSYSNSVGAFNKYLPTVNQIIKSIVILK